MTGEARLPAVGLERIGDVAILSFDRPQSLNSISLELITGVHEALDSLLADPAPARCLIVTGSGRAFCSGGDISAHRDRPADVEPYDLGDVLHRYFSPMLLRLLRLPIPFVTAVNGPAAGAGCPLALAGDIVIAGRSALFECGFSRVGLMPDLGATWLLPRLVGRARAHAMMLLDQRVPADLALQWGMIQDCVEDDALRDKALEIAAQLARGATAALVATRRVALLASACSLGEALEHEAEAQRDLGFACDFAEGISAFFGGRSPNFNGN